MHAQAAIDIVIPSTEAQYRQVQELIRAFVAWHRIRHVEDLPLINRYFDPEAFAHELASLPEKYASGRNRLLLASVAGDPAGCVALRELDAESCEMKRMFVSEQCQGKGVGKALAKAVIKEAKQLGFTRMKLDTSIRQVEAQKLYEGLGFQRTTPYYPLPKPVEEWLVFMELAL